jgi:hypothetical protein
MRRAFLVYQRFNYPFLFHDRSAWACLSRSRYTTLYRNKAFLGSGKYGLPSCQAISNYASQAILRHRRRLF